MLPLVYTIIHAKGGWYISFGGEVSPAYGSRADAEQDARQISELLSIAGERLVQSMLQMHVLAAWQPEPEAPIN